MALGEPPVLLAPKADAGAVLVKQAVAGETLCPPGVAVGRPAPARALDVNRVGRVGVVRQPVVRAPAARGPGNVGVAEEDERVRVGRRQLRRAAGDNAAGGRVGRGGVGLGGDVGLVSGVRRLALDVPRLAVDDKRPLELSLAGVRDDDAGPAERAVWPVECAPGGVVRGRGGGRPVDGREPGGEDKAREGEDGRAREGRGAVVGRGRARRGGRVEEVGRRRLSKG